MILVRRRNIEWITVFLQDLLKQGSTIALNFASKSTQKSDKTVGKWMLTCSGMVFIAVVLGTFGFFLFYYCVRTVVKVVTDETYGK